MWTRTNKLLSAEAWACREPRILADQPAIWTRFKASLHHADLVPLWRGFWSRHAIETKPVSENPVQWEGIPFLWRDKLTKTRYSALLGQLDYHSFLFEARISLWFQKPVKACNNISPEALADHSFIHTSAFFQINVEVRLGNQTQEEEKSKELEPQAWCPGPPHVAFALASARSMRDEQPHGWAETPRPAALAWKDGRMQPLVEEAVSSLPPLGHPPLSWALTEIAQQLPSPSFV